MLLKKQPKGEMPNNGNGPQNPMQEKKQVF